MGKAPAANAAPFSDFVSRRSLRPDAILFAAVVVVGLTFAIITQHAWEDYWITFRLSRNLAEGHGLVFTAGERLHTFTSPLGVLIPAGFRWALGSQSDGAVLWLFRLVSIGALAAGVVLFFRALEPLVKSRFSLFAALALFGLDSKTVDYTINGMETGLLFFFLALTVHGLLVSGPRQMVRLGAGWAGLMWTRPDSCIYIAILALGVVLFRPAANGGKGERAGMKKLLIAAGICTLLYLPWFLWAWCYYGSPVPHPITAKGVSDDPLTAASVFRRMLDFPANAIVANSSLRWVFLPTYAWFGGWSKIMEAVSLVLALLASVVWLVPVLRPQTRLFSFAFFAGNIFLSCVIKAFFPWYLAPVAALGYLAGGLLLDDLMRLAARLPGLGWDRGWFARLPLVLCGAAGVLVTGQLVVLVCAGRQLQVQQELIEDGLRRPIGQWLREKARTPQDTVMLEPLGYIGYYSGLKMLDYPGLASREVVAARRQLGPAKENQAYRELKPDWLVLRPNEAQNGTYVELEGLKNEYRLVKVFDAKDKVAAVKWLPGRPYLQFDQTFLIFHRQKD